MYDRVAVSGRRKIGTGRIAGVVFAVVGLVVVVAVARSFVCATLGVVVVTCSLMIATDDRRYGRSKRRREVGVCCYGRRSSAYRVGQGGGWKR